MSDAASVDFQHTMPKLVKTLTVRETTGIPHSPFFDIWLRNESTKLHET